ncbi:uncharacterized protein KGF55_005572 [Candida pseudojiufengensis]|uniref:uncharacterized protein n=1 Tax=Candida pseudojiufengensis TaxID=497109 RepID=UPI002225B185|nr:uncharacterized protein KGF55_005572 [Candida pseudojiufengensis]KAI5959081.1 hypothetical protein KGF55_005572 [Candida pseudojiufengensis]
MSKAPLSTLGSLNAEYLTYLVKYPLLTKSITSGILSGLNETISSAITNEYQESKILGFKVKHVFSPKLINMIIYGALISTPISHNLYAIINKIFTPPLTSKGKILRLLTSLFTVTPIITGCFVSWIAIINNYKPNLKSFNPINEIFRIYKIIVGGLKKGYLTTLKTSLTVSFVSLIVANNYIQPELWVVFFNVVYFVLGTYQNTKLKRLQKQQRLSK